MSAGQNARRIEGFSALFQHRHKFCLMGNLRSDCPNFLGTFRRVHDPTAADLRQDLIPSEGSVTTSSIRQNDDHATSATVDWRCLKRVVVVYPTLIADFSNSLIARIVLASRRLDPSDALLLAAVWEFFAMQLQLYGVGGMLCSCERRVYRGRRAGAVRWRHRRRWCW